MLRMSMAGDDFLEYAVVATGCQHCDHEAEFHGVVIDDVAHFPCSNCKQVFELGNIDGWSTFFEDEYDEEREYFDRWDI